jgi:ABC-type Mn2+/Zn2+ transport system permease subunit
MFNKFTTTDKLLFIAAFLSLIFSEILYFKGEINAAIFIGIWVPSILAFGIYLKRINNKKNDLNNAIFRRSHYTFIHSWLFISIKRNEKTKILNV